MGKNKLYLKSFAKINLYLDIGKRLGSGYHEIETILQTVNLFDEICFEKLDKPVFHIDCNHHEVPIDKNSIVYKAVTAIMEESSIADHHRGLAVSIKKKIPLASGLGGGSSNIATILLGINELFCINMEPSRLMNLAVNFGMDISYFIRRGTVYARGRGEVLFPLRSINPPIYLILVNPGIKISTQWAYQAFDQEKKKCEEKPVNIGSFIHRRKSVQFYEFDKIIYNRFDYTISKYYPVIRRIKNELKELGVLYSSLSGSGPSVFGIVENKQKLDEIYSSIKGHYPFVFKTNTVRAGNLYLKNFKRISNNN